jgi:hypothetical protein
MSTSEEIHADCKELDAELDRRSGELSEQALDHLRQCERCRRLYDFLSQQVPPFAPSSALSDSIEKRLKNSLGPVVLQPAPRVLAARFLIVFLLFGAPAIAMMGATGLHAMTSLQLVTMVAVLGLGAALVSLSLAWQMTPGSLHRVPAAAAVLGLATGFLLSTAILFPWLAPEAFLSRGWTCLRAGLLLALPAGGLFWLLARRGSAFALGTLGATLGALAGLLGTFVLQFHCDHQDASHLLVWHGSILILPALLGILATRGAILRIR